MACLHHRARSPTNTECAFSYFCPVPGLQRLDGSGARLLRGALEGDQPGLPAPPRTAPARRSDHAMDAQRWALEPETCRATGPLYQQLGPWNDVLIGRLLIALISTFFHVYIVWIHATQPAHPKMSLVPFRRRVLTVHIVSGSLEILVSLGSWFVVNCALAGRIHALLAVVHTCTALVQVQGGLFGMQLVMIPGYVLACLIKLTLAVLLALSPCCYGTSLALYLAHATYAWVRVLHNRFIYLHIFIGSEYTVAIIAAGVICGAAVSELYPFVLFALVGAYIIAARRFLSKEEFAYQQCENSRRLEDAFVDVGGGDRARRLETNLRNQFAKADTDGSGYLSHAEVMAMGSATFADLIKLRTSGDMREMNKVSVEDVIGLVQGHSRLLDANLKHDATEETQSQAAAEAEEACACSSGCWLLALAGLATPPRPHPP
ncbi:hypothetical protein T492DRAFT_1140781 [Pavlovales sp. CCMP2436]|nr:hypothetical protein T492DRAFT_1140781 [Pavlovales sp. CCMP2436]